jgi:acyl-CoA synthetase (NDP forming)
MSTATAPDLHALFAPASIAVAGASADLGKPGGRVLDFLGQLGYAGRIYPINPRGGEIGGREVFTSVADLPEPADLLIVAVAAPLVVELLDAAGGAGVRSAIVLSSGFGEAGPEGVERERALVEVAERHEIALMGPNCLGYVDLGAGIAATFSTALQVTDKLRDGGIGFISQSGAMGASIFGLAQQQGVGLGTFASTGNEAVLDVAAVFDHYAGSENLNVLLGYVEGTSDGRRLLAALRATRESGIDIALLKVGTTESGSRAAASHTGALAGSDAAWDAALRRAGAIRVRSPHELLDAGPTLDSRRRPAGDRVGIVSMSGGAAVMMSDRAEELGFSIPPLDQATRARLAAALPGFAALDNPVDYGGAYGSPEAILATVAAVAESPDVDSVLVFVGLSPKLAGQIEPGLVAIAEHSDKPLVVAWLGGPEDSIRALRERGVPACADPVRAVELAALLRASSRPLPADLPLPEPDAALDAKLAGLREDGRGQLSEHETMSLLADHGVPCAEARAVSDPEAARSAARELGGRVVVKALAPDLLHKSDAGAVELDLGPDEAAEAFGRVVAAAGAAGVPTERALIATMAADDGLELIVGSRWDPQFGPLIMVGAGGVESEVHEDVCVDLAPIDAEAATAMLERLRIAPLLQGFRGSPPLDLGAAAEAVAAVSRFAAAAGPTLAELDLNPVAVYPEGRGCLALDAAAVLEATA